MKHTFKNTAAAACGAATLLMLTVGCGGSHKASVSNSSTGVIGANPAPAAARGAGKARFSLTWPNPQTTRLIPSASNSVRLSLIKDGAPLAGRERVLTRPEFGADLTTTVEWSDLPLGDLTIIASAYPSTDATGVAQAQASVVASIEDKVFKNVTLVLQSTIDHLQITMGALSPATAIAPATIFKTDTLPLAVSAVDKDGNVIVVGGTYQWTSSDARNAPVQSAPEQSAAATLTGANATVATITVTEVESGKTASVQVPVTAFRIVRLPNAEIKNDIFYVDRNRDIVKAINDSGTLLGPRYHTEYVQKVPYSTAARVLLPDTGFTRPYYSIESAGINNQEQVIGHVNYVVTGVGEFGIPYSYIKSVPAFWNGLSTVDARQPADGYTSVAYDAINASGIIVGEFTRGSGSAQVYTSGLLDTATFSVKPIASRFIPRYYDNINSYSFPIEYIDLSSSGTAIGNVTDDAYKEPNGPYLARYTGLVTRDGASEAQPILPLPAHFATRAEKINASGQVVGASIRRQGNYSEYQAIVWTAADGTKALPLPDGDYDDYRYAYPNLTSLASFAYGINDNGFITGRSRAYPSNEIHGLLWRNGTPFILNNLCTDVSQYRVETALTITNTNYIGVVLVDANDNSRDRKAYQGVLVPVTTTSGSTP